MTGEETPMTKSQTPSKSQIPSSQCQFSLAVGSLGVGWGLELGIWDFVHWDLEFVAEAGDCHDH
jgi:hypothetical protein